MSFGHLGMKYGAGSMFYFLHRNICSEIAWYMAIYGVAQRKLLVRRNIRFEIA